VKKNISIILLSFFFILFARTTFSDECGNYGGDSCSNKTNQEVGDAVYNKLGWSVIPGVPDYNHAGIYIGLDSYGLHLVIEATSLLDTVNTSYFSDFVNPSTDYYNAYNVGNLSKTDRNNIVSYARQFESDNTINYTLFNAIDEEGWYWDGIVSDVDNTRCDGVVEFSYEKAGKMVWGWNGNINYYDITIPTTSLTSVVSHN